MIKDILLNLSVAAAEDATVGYAVSLAKTFGARLTGLAFAYEKMPSGIIGDERWIDGVEGLRKEAEGVAQAAVTRLEKSGRVADLAISTRRLATTFTGTAEAFGRIARRYDLSVVRQAEPRTGTSDELIIRAALFDSGRPVLIVPSALRNPARFEQIVICWDGSRSAARAAADALPFLRRAKAVEVVTVGDREEANSVSAADFADHLTHHGLPARAKQITALDSDIPGRIIAHAAEMSADLVVMGGWGHSRLREFVLGGATRGVLAAMTTPTLMSH
jgi:nucleotide-binding universal stress UspA family protein